MTCSEASGKEISLPEIDEEEKEDLSAASRILLVLLDPDHKQMLDTAYEGSSFTSMIGAEIGLEVPDDEGDRDRLKPVREGLALLRQKGALSFERYDVEMSDEESDNGTSQKRPELASVIQVVLDPDKALAFLDGELKARD
jgi:hypothetical protein